MNLTKEEIIQKLKEIAEKDEDYTLDIDGWYNRIAKSTGDFNAIAKYHHIPKYLVMQIKNQEEENERTS